jgi:hypothetical protein
VGCIQISEATYGLIKGSHTFKATGGVEVKGKVGAPACGVGQVVREDR